MFAAADTVTAVEENIIIQQHSTNAADPDGTNRRLALLQRNRELAEHFASQSPDKDVVVLVFDVSNENIPLPNLDAKWVHKVIEEGNIPAVLMGMPRWSAYKGLQKFQRELHKLNCGDPKVSPVVEKLSAPAPAGHFFMMVISKGKQSVTLPIPV
jgi:hypothetical protein